MPPSRPPPPPGERRRGRSPRQEWNAGAARREDGRARGLAERRTGSGVGRGAMSRVPITMATWDYDRIRAIKDGVVQVEGCAVNHITLRPEEAFFRLFTYHEFDVSEMSFSSYVLARSNGDFP